MQAAQRAPHDDARPTSPLTRRPLLVARFQNAYAKVRAICMYANLPENEQTTKNAANKSRSKINCLAFVPLQKWEIETIEAGIYRFKHPILELGLCRTSDSLIISMGAKEKESSIVYLLCLISGLVVSILNGKFKTHVFL